MQLIGITVFSDKKAGTLINTIDTKTKLALGKRAKNDALAFLEEKGISVGKKVTYAVKQAGKNEFWANPKKDLLNHEWWLVLNNNETMELIVLKIPGGSLPLKVGATDGLLIRQDKPDLIDLNINTSSLKDRKSNVDFSVYVVKRIKY